MDSIKRKTVIGGNWKMNLLPSQVKDYAKALKYFSIDIPNVEIIVAVPFVCLGAAVDSFRESPVLVAAQNVSQHPSGAYTGEVSAAQLADIGAGAVLIGHSERRAYFGETDITVNQKVRAAIASGLRPIICVGETLEVRQLSSAYELVSYQVKSALSGVTAEELSGVVIAYEPVWAIGTGNVATPEQAQEMCASIRRAVADIYGKELSETVPIIYGGSMDSTNSRQLISLPDIDGGLIGRASLTPESFFRIIDSAR